MNVRVYIRSATMDTAINSSIDDTPTTTGTCESNEPGGSSGGSSEVDILTKLYNNRLVLWLFV